MIGNYSKFALIVWGFCFCCCGGGGERGKEELVPATILPLLQYKKIISPIIFSSIASQYYFCLGIFSQFRLAKFLTRQAGCSQSAICCWLPIDWQTSPIFFTSLSGSINSRFIEPLVGCFIWLEGMYLASEQSHPICSMFHIYSGGF